jgi:hypothetical protein
MKIEKVTYQKAFVVGPYLQERIGIEIQLDDADTPQYVLNQAKAIVEGWHKEANPHLFVEGGPLAIGPMGVQHVGEKKTPTEIILEGIGTCTDLTVLKSYSLMATREEITKKAYDQKFEELSK